MRKGNNLMEILESISWPHITLILGVVFLLLFRKEIGNVILRIKRFGKEGVHVDDELIPQKTEETETSSILDHIEIEKTVLLKVVEGSIFQDLENRGLDYGSDTTKVLVRNLAVERIRLEHEQTYSAIFGSQILLLKKLNEVMGSGREREYIEGIFASVKKHYPEEFSNWTVDIYSRFLFDRSLITIQDDNFHITDKGQDFLIWLARTGKQEDKNY
jgi:hypothetical protein